MCNISNIFIIFLLVIVSKALLKSIRIASISLLCSHVYWNIYSRVRLLWLTLIRSETFLLLSPLITSPFDYRIFRLFFTIIIYSCSFLSLPSQQVPSFSRLLLEILHFVVYRFPPLSSYLLPLPIRPFVNFPLVQ